MQRKALSMTAHLSSRGLSGRRPVITLLSSLAVLGLLTACATTTIAPPFASQQSQIVVEADPQQGYWRATYELAQPVSELRFERTPFRSGVFEVLTEGFVLVRDGDTEVLRTDGAPVTRVAVRFPEYSRELEKEYDFFQQFTDGSVAIYTGHLAVRPAVAGCEDCAIRRFRFVPPPGRHVVAGGRVVRGAADWSDGDGEGAYVYIGSIAPIESEGLIAIVDPGLPSWLWEEARRALPRIFDEYSARLGVRLAERPLVLFNYTDGGGSGYSSGGGVLPGQIQLRADGAAWKNRSDVALRHLLRFLAHEAAHLWNGRLIRYEGSDDAWMHEGSAEALADRMLRNLGYLDGGGFDRRQTDAFNDCSRRLAGFPLRDAAKRNAFQLYYDCGNSLALFTEQSVASRDLFDFWKALIARVRASGRTAFDTSDYFATMAAAGASDESVERVREFTERSSSPEALAGLLRASGVQVAEAMPSEAFGQSVARDALFRLLGEQCTGPYGFTGVESGFSLTASSTCGALSGGGVVTTIGGHDVLRDGAGTMKVLHERCGSDDPVPVVLVVEGVTRTVAVPCRKAVAAPAPYLAVSTQRK